MADQTEIIKIEFDSSEALVAAKDVEVLRAKTKELKEDADKYKGTQDENTAAHIRAQVQYKISANDLKTQEALLLNVTKAEKTDIVTLESLSVRNKILATERQGLNIQTKEGALRVNEINNEINKNNEIIAANSDKLKQQKMNVGNYTDSVKQALSETGLWGSSSENALNKIKGGFDKVKGAGSSISTMFKGTKTDIASTVSTAGTLAPTMVAGEAATGGVSGAMKILKIAVAGTGIGLLLVAFASLVAWFTKSAEGLRLLKVAGAAVGAVFDAWLGTITKIGGLLKDVLTLNFSKIKEDVKGIGSEWANVGDNIKGAIELVQKEMKLTKDKRAALIEEAEINRDIAKSVLDASDKTKTHKERIESLKKSLEGQDLLMKKRISMAQEELDIVEYRIKRDEAHGKKAAKEDKDMEAQLKADKINAEADSYSGSRRSKSKLTQFQLELIKEENENRLKAEERFYKNKLGYAESEALKQKENTDERLAYDLKVLEIKRKKETSTNGVTRGEVASINAKYDEQEKKAIDLLSKYKADKAKTDAEIAISEMTSELTEWKNNYEQKRKQIDDSSLSYEEYTKKIKEQYDEQLQHENDVFIKSKEILDLKLKDGIVKQKDYNKELTALELKKEDNTNAIIQLNKENEKARKLSAAQTDYENDLALAQDNMFALLDLQKVSNDQKRAEEMKAAEKIGASTAKIKAKYDKADLELEKAKTKAKLALAAGFAGNIATIFGESTKLGKAAAVAQTMISTYASATGAFASFTAPPVAGVLSVPLGIAAAGAAIASGLSNVKKILAVKSDGTGSVDTSTPSSVTPSMPTPTVNNVIPEVGQGIVSRQSLSSLQQLSVNTQPTLVVDAVTAKQTAQAQKNETASL